MWRRRWPEIAWAAFAALNVAVLFTIGRWETIPFHFVWVSLALVYGVRRWSLRATLITLAVVSLATSAALLRAVTSSPDGPGLDELAEPPLMAAVFLAMVWHAERARRAIAIQDRLAERQRDFVRDASHELRTPIAVALGHAELIRAAARPGQLAADAQVVVEELGRLSRLTERMLTLATIEHTEFLHPTWVDTEVLIERMLQRWMPAAERGWTLGAVVAGGVLVDEERLALALDALIENAVKFTEVGDRIELSARAVGETRLEVEVADSGAGITRDQLPLVFDRFARADGDRSRGTGGTGLGLAIVKAIVEAHGGEVTATSEPGMGSSFIIALPTFRRDAPSRSALGSAAIA